MGRSRSRSFWRARIKEGTLPGEELRAVMEALLSAFTSRSALARMVRFRLDRNLNELASERNLVDTTFELITSAEACGFLNELLEGAFAEAPRNPALLMLKARWSRPTPPKGMSQERAMAVNRSSSPSEPSTLHETKTPRRPSW